MKNPFSRQPTPTPSATAAAVLAAERAADAAGQIAEVAQRQVAIIGAQADEIERLRRQLAEHEQATVNALAAARYWNAKAIEMARRDLSAILAANLARYANPN